MYIIKMGRVLALLTAVVKILFISLDSIVASLYGKSSKQYFARALSSLRSILHSLDIKQVLLTLREACVSCEFFVFLPTKSSKGLFSFDDEVQKEISKH